MMEEHSSESSATKEEQTRENDVIEPSDNIAVVDSLPVADLPSEPIQVVETTQQTNDNEDAVKDLSDKLLKLETEYVPPIAESAPIHPIQDLPLAPLAIHENPVEIIHNQDSLQVPDTPEEAKPSTSRSPSPSRRPTPEPDSFYSLKPIQWIDLKTRRLIDLKVICQNKNGPCPLIALSKALSHPCTSV